MPVSAKQRAAVALALLWRVEGSSAAAARSFGGTRQRWHQRLAVAKRMGWVTSGGELTPRGVQVVASYEAQLAALEETRGSLPIDEVLGGGWYGTKVKPQRS